ncbi:DNA primase, partial [Lactiplantibacillus garii]
MDDDIKEAIAGYNHKPKKTANLQKKFKNRDEMASVLHDEVELWQLDHQTDRQIKQDKLPPLTTLAGADILRRHFHFCLFANNESERLAVYLPDQGIYTQNYLFLKQLIAIMYRPFVERQAEDVIYHLKTVAKVQTLTNDRYLVPVNNGIWNLHQHKLMPFSPRYVFTTKIATDYHENPVPPNIKGWTFDGWLNELACDDQEIVKLFWEVIADSLNGNYTRKKAIFLFSELGSSGKGTFQELISNLVGNANVATLKVNEFDMRFRLAGLVGKTVCIGDDIAPDIYIKDSSNFNSVVTGDLVNVENKGQDGYTARLMPTIIQSCNGLPNFHNKGGTIRRIVIVPFNNHFQGNGDNWNVRNDYIARQAVLEYVLYQALQLDFEKFDIPTASQQALTEFEEDNDPLIGFKSSFFDEININKIPTYYLYEYYKKYCKVNGLGIYGQTKFVRRFMTLITGYEKKQAKLSSDDLKRISEIRH